MIWGMAASHSQTTSSKYDHQQPQNPHRHDNQGHKQYITSAAFERVPLCKQCGEERQGGGRKEGGGAGCEEDEKGGREVWWSVERLGGKKRFWCGWELKDRVM